MSMRNVPLPDGKLRQAQGAPRRHTGAQAKSRAFGTISPQKRTASATTPVSGSCNYLHDPVIGQTRHCVLALDNWDQSRSPLPTGRPARPRRQERLLPPIPRPRSRPSIESSNQSALYDARSTAHEEILT
jgi:hypothetical protein